jgi:hypothetical protein
MKNLIFIFTCLFLFIFLSCNSSISDITIEDVGQIEGDINIEQDVLDINKNYITARLYDGEGKSIVNDSISIIVNDVEIKVTHSGGFYSEGARYYVENIPVINNKYVFNILLSNKKRYFLGEINALKKENTAQISCDKKGDYTKDILIKWTGLKDIDNLIITNSIELKSGDGYEGDAIDSVKITSDGSYIFPKSKFEYPKGKIHVIRFDFKARKTGVVNEKLLKGSQIAIETFVVNDFQKDVFFEKVTKK